ncbi:MAG: hypothetical protein DCE90_01810 [Pseudanabaena sp.]|nr:MAG: hypothetical protein DCE90_01810 [Pseudanabaena sp.]
MKLIFAIILWLTNKAVSIILFVAILTALFTANTILQPIGQDLWNQVSGKDIQEAINRIGEDIKQLEINTNPQFKSGISRLNQDINLRIEAECTKEIPWYEFYRFDIRLQREANCELLRKEKAAYQQLEKEYIEREQQLRDLKAQLSQKQFQLEESEQQLDRIWKLLIINFQENWIYIFCTILLVLFASPLWKAWCFFGIAHFAERFAPIQLTDPVADGNIFYKNAEKTVSIRVDLFNPLYMRMDSMNQYDRNLTKRTRLFWRWSAPFISYASGLVELTEFTTKSTVEGGTVVLSPKKASDYITEVQLQQHPGIVMRPAFITGISGDIQLKTRWIWSFHSWLTGQHRYIIFYGTGKLYLEGNGGIYAMEVSPAKTSVESHLLIGFDSRLGYSTIRTETFWPYFRNKVSLIDNQLSGKGVFLRQAVAPTKKLTPLEKNFQFISNFTSIVGKFFGF